MVPDSYFPIKFNPSLMRLRFHFFKISYPLNLFLPKVHYQDITFRCRNGCPIIPFGKKGYHFPQEVLLELPCLIAIFSNKLSPAVLNNNPFAPLSLLCLVWDFDSFFSRGLTPSTFSLQKSTIKTLLFDVETVALLFLLAKKLMFCFFPGKKLLLF